jgi:DNA-binding MarR family transcriptional regulator
MTKRDAIDQMYDDLFGVRKASKAQETVPHNSTDDDQKDQLFEEAITVINEHDRVSSSLLQRRLRIGYARAARIIDRLEAEGLVGSVDGTASRVVLRGKTLEEAKAAHKLRAGRQRSYEVQEELLKKHQAKASLVTISELVKEEIIQILGAYLREGWDRNEVISRIKEEPGLLAEEIGSRVGKTVAGVLAAGNDWPNSVSQEHHRRTEVAFTVKEIQEILHCMHWMNAAAYSRQANERSMYPGWDHRWLCERLRAAGCYVPGRHWTGKVADPSLSHVIVRRDGSVTKVGLDNSVTEVGPVPAEQQLPPLVTRQLKRSPNAGQWRSEITHEWIEGKGWVRITELDRKEH